MISQGVPIGISFRANVTFGLLSAMGGLVYSGGRSVVKLGRAPIAEVSAVMHLIFDVQLIGVIGSSSILDFIVRFDGVP